LAVAPPREGGGGQHLADQPHQLLVADRWHRPGSAWLANDPPAGVGRRWSSGGHPAPGTPPPRQVVLHGYLGRFPGGICWSATGACRSATSGALTSCWGSSA